MSKPLVGRFTIPLFEEHFSKDTSLVFQYWLPLRGDDALIATEENLTLRLWIDQQCLSDVTEIDLEHTGKYANICVRKINVDATGIDVSDELADVMVKLAVEHNWSPEYIRQTYDASLIAEYDEIGERIYSAVVKQFNRFIAYVRVVEGQYWSQEYSPRPWNTYSEFLNLRAKVKVGKSDWLRLTSTRPVHIGVTIPIGEQLIAKEDWQGIREHLAGSERTPLSGQLLAAADEFVQSGHRRVALTEAVTALEIAVDRFAHERTLKVGQHYLLGAPAQKNSASTLTILALPAL